MPAHDHLRSIRSFPELVGYLETELDWPLQEYGFDDLTFEYTPAELGLKEEDAARIKAIHQLRPLASGQPWGIFFVEFENKKLPVVVLRRILSHLAVKKRASANKASAPAWHAEDLLFITAFGEDGTDAREIAFAHFHQNPGDMPTLHVLGWDGGDTPLKYDHVDQVLRERLRWPADEKDTQAWRETWSQPFKHRIGYIIQTSSLLAEELASLARGIRDKAKLLLAAESEKGEITKLYKAFQTALIHDLTPESFADTYAQTITYGLLTAAISRTDISEGRYGTFVKADDIADMVPITNPFLKEMLQTFLKVGGRKGGIDFDELGIQDVVELLRGDETDLPAILRDFGNKTRGEDPVIHFYEHFLSAYNKKLKIQRGVFYTPQPVVSYIVRSVHELLQTEFGLEDGLASTITWGEMTARQIPPSPPFSKGGAIAPCAEEGENNKTESFPPLKKGGEGGFKIPEGTSPGEPFVVILDPATGTATFLVEVINVIHRTLTEKWTRQGMNPAQRLEAWNDYVPKHLLPRLYGYELMMAPYAIAHMKIGLKLAETGYRFASNERVRIYLTNALEPWQRQLKLPDFEALAHEAVAVNEVKREKRFTVIVGNPPYSNFGQFNRNPFILGLLEDYKRGLDEKKLNLDDDFIKFVRFSQHLLEKAGVGVLGMITNNVFIDGITHRRIRESLVESFQVIRILDLHGSSIKKEQSPDGAKDENVFDIKQGVGVGIFCKSAWALNPTAIWHSELWGLRASKYAVLEHLKVADGSWKLLDAKSPYHFFVPKDFDLEDEYRPGWSTTDMFRLAGQGIETKRDALTIRFTSGQVQESLEDMRRGSKSAVASKYGLPEDGRDWTFDWAKEDVLKNKGQIAEIAYRPFDYRFTYFTGRTKGFIAYPRTSVSRCLLAKNNLGLVVNRFVKLDFYAHVFVIRGLIERHLLETANACLVVYPLSTHESAKDNTLDFGVESGQLNFATSFLSAVGDALRLKLVGSQRVPAGLTPEDIFHYIYAVFHSPGYRTRYAEFLKIDFPRLPLTGNLELFRALAQLGGELVALHLLESTRLDHPITEFIGGKNPEVEKPSWSDNAVWVDKAQTTGFKGVREEVWDFHIGGYQVCQKWLKDRKGRTLTKDDLAHYQKIVIALSETIRLMAEIDRVIETHGGWPGAFQPSALQGSV